MKRDLTKKVSARKASIPELLTAIYNREIHESAFIHASPEKMRLFILEVFNKGILTDYLELKTNGKT